MKMSIQVFGPQCSVMDARDNYEITPKELIYGNGHWKTERFSFNDIGTGQLARVQKRVHRDKKWGY